MRSEPQWLTAEHAVEFNRLTVEQTKEPFQLRDLGLLESALASPVNHWHHGEISYGRLAAQLLLAVARNHPFAQGNKRTALLLADAFLSVNGMLLQHPDETFADLILGVLTRDIEEGDFIRRFNEATVRPRPSRKVLASLYRHASTGQYHSSGPKKR